MIKRKFCKQVDPPQIKSLLVRFGNPISKKEVLQKFWFGLQAKVSLQREQDFLTGKTKHREYLFVREFLGKSRSLRLTKKLCREEKGGNLLSEQGRQKQIVSATRKKGFVGALLQVLTYKNERLNTLSCFGGNTNLTENKNTFAKQSFARLQKKSSVFSSDFRVTQLLFASNHFYRVTPNRKLGYLYPTNLDKMSLLDSDLADLALSLKTYTFLKQKGIHKIGSFIRYSKKDLLQLLNRDTEMFAEVERCFLLLALYGNV